MALGEDCERGLTMAFQLLNFLGFGCNKAGAGNCGRGGARDAVAPDLPAFAPPITPSAPGWGPAALPGDQAPQAAQGLPSALGLPMAAAAPAPQAPPPATTRAARAAPAAGPAGGGFFDHLLAGLGNLFGQGPRNPGLAQADATVANLGRQGGQVLDQVRGVVDQAIATGKGLLDKFVGFLRGVFGDVDRLVQQFTGNR